MTASTVTAAVFLVVSLASLMVQGTLLTRIARRSPHATVAQRLVHRGLLRTSTCRVAAAVLYTGLGTFALIAPLQTGTVALGAFIVVQILWWANAAADVRLQHRLTEPGSSR